MTKYRIKITRHSHLGGGVSYLTNGYGWHPDIEPMEFTSLYAATQWKGILKVEDRYKILYTGNVEIETIQDKPTSALASLASLAVVAVIIEAIVIACLILSR